MQISNNFHCECIQNEKCGVQHLIRRNMFIYICQYVNVYKTFLKTQVVCALFLIRRVLLSEPHDVLSIHDSIFARWQLHKKAWISSLRIRTKRRQNTESNTNAEINRTESKMSEPYSHTHVVCCMCSICDMIHIYRKQKTLFLRW